MGHDGVCRVVQANRKPAVRIKAHTCACAVAATAAAAVPPAERQSRMCEVNYINGCACTKEQGHVNPAELWQQHELQWQQPAPSAEQLSWLRKDTVFCIGGSTRTKDVAGFLHETQQMPKEPVQVCQGCTCMCTSSNLHTCLRSGLGAQVSVRGDAALGVNCARHALAQYSRRCGQTRMHYSSSIPRVRVRQAAYELQRPSESAEPSGTHARCH
eukprot:1159338-Pelagomonas_calceolata.AAC.27